MVHLYLRVSWFPSTSFLEHTTYFLSHPHKMPVGIAGPNDAQPERQAIRTGEARNRKHRYVKDCPHRAEGLNLVR